MNERTQREQVVKNMEAVMNKTKLEYNTQLYSTSLDAEKWKQGAISTAREVQLLQEQLNNVQVIIFSTSIITNNTLHLKNISN